MAFDTRAALAREAVTKLAGSGLEPHELLHEASARIQRVVPYDLGGWMTMDPDSFLPTGNIRSGKPAELVDAFWRNELLTPDLHKFTELSRRRSNVAVLSTVDAATADASPRHHLIRDSAGLGDEARVVLRANGAVWGAACLHRPSDASDFRLEEREFLAQIADVLGRGLQLSLSGRPELAPVADSPGVLVMDPELPPTVRVLSATLEADKLIGRFPGDWSATIFGVAARVFDERHPARARVRLVDGTWLLLHAALLDGGPRDARRVAVILDPAPRADVVSLMLRLNGLSTRERDVARLLLAGLATDDLATQLHISRHTLRDHIKSIFMKVGATSRSELMALVSGDTAPELL